jgi:nicotinic acid phosphoribosyltransferase
MYINYTEFTVTPDEVKHGDLIDVGGIVFVVVAPVHQTSNGEFEILAAVNHLRSTPSPRLKMTLPKTENIITLIRK